MMRNMHVAPWLATALLGGTLAGLAFLPRPVAWTGALLIIILLGVPHGALDTEIGRNLLRPRFGWGWFPIFALPYLLLATGVLLAWHWAPQATLAAFLAGSAWHFGTEDAGTGGLAALGLGGLPIGIPVLLQPSRTAHILSVAAGTDLHGIPAWLFVAALAWAGLFAMTAATLRRRLLAQAAALFALFAVAPPLMAFAFYFVGLHAPAHMAGLIRGGWAPRIRTLPLAWRLSIPTTLLTLLLGALLWPFYHGRLPDRLLCLTLQMLAALTLPHMLLGFWLARHETRPAA